MRRFGKLVKASSALLIALALTIASAQFPGAAATGGQTNPLAGVWQTTVHVDPSMPPAIGVLQVLSDGSYREEMYLYDQLAAYWSGYLSLAADGSLTQTETDVSPQICVPQGCMQNDAPSTFNTFVQFHNADVFTMSGMGIAITYSRFYLSAESNAQTTAGIQPSSSQAGSIVGSWQNALYLDAGTIINVRTFYPDGTFYAAGYNLGRLTNAEAGTYTLSGGGMLTLQVQEATPQFCFLYCQPNSVKPGSTRSERVTFQDTDLLLVDEARAPGGKIYWQRGDGTRGPVIAAMPTPAATPGGGNPPSAYGVSNLPNTGGYVPSGGDGGSGSNADFINGVIYGQSAYTNQYDGSSYYLPDVADPGMNYYSPSGNGVVYNDVTGGWTEVDAYGFETELDSAW